VKATDFKIVARWRYDTCQNARNFFKIWENGCKVCAHDFDHLEVMSWKKTYHSLLPHVHQYKNILLAHYRVLWKTFKFVPVVLKAHGRANFCAHQKSINPCISKYVLGAFCMGWFVVVHPYSNFSLRRQMAPVQSIKFQTVNFLIFCTRIIVIFLNNWRKFFCCGNGQWETRPVGITLVLLYVWELSVCVCIFRSFKLLHIINMNVVLKMHDVQNFVDVTDMQMWAHVGI